MLGMETIQVKTTFSEDIRTGLGSSPKHIPSKYFYDENGSRIFQKIMRMPEYYPTDCEYEVFRDFAHEIFQLINHDKGRFDLIELGAGDGLKTSLLISHFLEEKALFKYIPIDISVDALLNLVRKLRLSFPGLLVCSEVAGDYFEVLKNEFLRRLQESHSLPWLKYLVIIPRGSTWFFQYTRFHSQVR